MHCCVSSCLPHLLVLHLQRSLPKSHICIYTQVVRKSSPLGTFQDIHFWNERHHGKQPSAGAISTFREQFWLFSIFSSFPLGRGRWPRNLVQNNFHREGLGPLFMVIFFGKIKFWDVSFLKYLFSGLNCWHYTATWVQKDSRRRRFFWWEFKIIFFFFFSSKRLFPKWLGKHYRWEVLSWVQLLSYSRLEESTGCLRVCNFVINSDALLMNLEWPFINGTLSSEWRHHEKEKKRFSFWEGSTV